MNKTADKTRIGIYAGTFDPVHKGHLSFAREALKQCKLDKVFFLVEPRPRRKQGVKALLHRQYMVHLAIADEPKFGSIMLEQERYDVAETMPILQERFKGAELHMLMGDDVLFHLSDWPNSDMLIDSTSFIIGIRKKPPEAIKKHIKLLEKTKGVSFQYKTFDITSSDISSSRIRKAIRSGKEPVEITPAVMEYIQAQNLYASSGDTA